MQITCANCGKGVSIEGPSGTPGECSCGNKITVPTQPVKEQFGVARCTNCWKRYGVVGRPPGTRFKCKACGQIITIRQPGKKAAPAPKASGAPKARKRGAALTKKRKIDQLAETQDMDALPTAPPRKGLAGGSPVVPPGPTAAAGRQMAKEITDLRASVQKFKAAAEQSTAAARQARGQMEEKEHLLEEKTAEIARRDEEVKTLQERNARQAEEISTLQSDLDGRAGEIEDLKSKVTGLEEAVKAREAERDEREEKVRDLERELAGRATREETEKYNAEKQEIEKRLDEGGAKLSSTKEALASLREPLAEALRRFDELRTEAGAIDFPDFSEEFGKVRREAQERGDALVQLKRALDEESRAKEKAAAEAEGLQEELASARKAHEKFVMAAEEEIEQLASSAAAAEERKGFLKGLFGGKKEPDTARRAKSSRMKLKVAAARAAEPAPGSLEDAVGMDDASEVEEAVEAEEISDDAVEIAEEELDPIDFDAFEQPGGDLAEAEEVEVEEAEEVEVAEVDEESAPAKGTRGRKASRGKKPERGGRRRKR